MTKNVDNANQKDSLRKSVRTDNLGESYKWSRGWGGGGSGLEITIRKADSLGTV